MALSQVVIQDFRNLEKIELEPLREGFNFLYGRNGSGKTSFLEAIYYLGHRRSFRSLSTERLIRYSSDRFNLFSQINDQFGQTIPMGVERLQEGDFRVRIDGQDVSTISELAAVLPMRLINVHSHYLIEGSPSFRRKYLDWGIFYQNKEFHAVWFRFKRLLKQRNAALRARASTPELASWTRELAETALIFHDLRVSYVAQLLPVLKEIFDRGLASAFDLSGLTIDYRSGWDDERPYLEVLSTNLARDFERGYTQFGPHRGDLSFKIKGIPAKEVLSTGQQKLLVCGMILAQGALLAGLSNKRPIYLVDDLPAELDVQSRSWLIRTLAEQQAQIFVTAVEQEAMSDILAQLGSPVKMFHVKHGTITEVSASFSAA
jgi:DNA replication and repair protein RecF